MQLTLHTDGLNGMLEFGEACSEGWRKCAVSVKAAGFTADYSCFVEDCDLRSFLSALELAMSNLGVATTIEFNTIEQGIYMKLDLNARGSVAGAFEFAGDVTVGPRLAGVFQADQTHLVGWIKETRSILRT